MKRVVGLILTLALLLSLASCDGKKKAQTVEFDNGDVKMIAHRGLSGIEVENTESAFVAAGERSYYGIEADVRRTKDGKFVIAHDPDLKRISGEKIEVEDLTLAELLEIELYGKEGREGETERLTDLETYISVCKEYGKQAILEMKTSFTDSEIEGIIGIINTLGYLHRVIFISFNYENLQKVRALLPEQPCQYLFSKLTDETLEKLSRDGIDAAIKYTHATRENVDRLHSAGILVNCWTVDSKTVAEQLIKNGVDYITTNILE